MSRLGSNKIAAVSAALGAAAGFAALHPYTMLVYGLYGRTSGAPETGGLLDSVLSCFRPGMLHMGLPFALLGGVTGALFGFWLNARRRHEKAEMRACAVDTLKQLMVTLSHYLLNAGAIIGGFASRSLKKTEDPETRRHLEVILREAECIEAVVNSLKSLEAVAAEHYTKNGETMIIDITRELEKRLGEETVELPADTDEGEAGR